MPIEKQGPAETEHVSFMISGLSLLTLKKKSLSLKSLKKVVMKDRQEGTLGPRKGGWGFPLSSVQGEMGMWMGSMEDYYRDPELN